ncbi:nucleoside hydrolase, partial [Bacillus subtilis]|nr:nucleoside hydrolase [Bacillus subtilis]
LTNIALALIKAPEIKENIEEIILMGGGTFGNWTPTAEFNIWADPEAAKKVFDSGIPLIVMGLDITHQAVATDNVINQVMN